MHIIDQIRAVLVRLVTIHQFIWRDNNDFGTFQRWAIAVGLFLAACAPIETQQMNSDESLTFEPGLDVVRVDAKVTLKDLTHHPVGINLNYLMDDDALLNPETGIIESLRELGVKYLRYPGGEKSDNYLWTIPPWPTSAMDRLQPMLARTDPKEWPSATRFTGKDMATLIPEVLDFAEFMSVCNAIQCEPVIVVAADSAHVPAVGLGKIPTRQRLIESAAEWVRYANLTRGYGIRFWMIGNETWNEKSFIGFADAETYAGDLIDFSIAMKAIDPSIRIVANGNSDKWWKTVLGRASGSIDYLAVSNYPRYHPFEFETYQLSDVELDRQVQIAISAIDKYASSYDKGRLKVIVAETNVINWWKEGWENHNDLGHALVLFQMVGDLLVQEKVAFIQYWTTRWIDDDSLESPRVFDAIDQNGKLQPTGLVLAIWGNGLLDSVVSTVGTKEIKVYGSLSQETDQLNVFLLNKDNQPRPVAIEILGHKSKGTVVQKSLVGSGYQDTQPKWWIGTVELADQRIVLTLPSVSITVLEIPAASDEFSAGLR